MVQRILSPLCLPFHHPGGKATLVEHLDRNERYNREERRHPDLNRGWRFCRPLPYHLAMPPLLKRSYQAGPTEAGDRARTGDPNLGKVVLYQLSYTRVTSSKARDYIAESFFLSKPKSRPHSHHSRDSVPRMRRCRLPRCAPIIRNAAAAAANTSGAGSPRSKASKGTTRAASMDAAET